MLMAGIDALLGDAAVEVELHVAGALELLVDHVVHARAGVDQGGGDDGQRAAFLDVAGGAEEALGPLQGVGVDAAGQDLAGGRHHGVVGAGQAGDGVEQDRPRRGLCSTRRLAFSMTISATWTWRVAGSSKVEAMTSPRTRALHLGHFLRALVDQQHDQVALGVVVRDGVGDVLQHHGLAGLGRRDDQAALALADGRDQVDDAAGDVLGAAVAGSSFSRFVGNSGVRFSNRILLRAFSGGRS